MTQTVADNCRSNKPLPVSIAHNIQGIRSHAAMVERLKKSLYYGKIKEANEVMECPSLPLTEVTVEMVEEAIKKRGCPSSGAGLDVFDLHYASSVSEKACISPCSIIMALVYIERLKRKNPDYLRTVSPCDLFLVSMMIASKYLFDDGEDEEVFNDEWAASGAIDLKDLNRNERKFLAAIDWDIYVDPKTFFKQLSKIEALVTIKESKKRIWNGLTYNELLNLATFPYESPLQQHFWSQFSDNFLKIMMTTIVTYSAVVLTLFGATIIACSFHVCLTSTLLQTPTSQNRTFSVPGEVPLEPVRFYRDPDFKTAIVREADQRELETTRYEQRMGGDIELNEHQLLPKDMNPVKRTSLFNRPKGYFNLFTLNQIDCSSSLQVRFV